MFTEVSWISCQTHFCWKTSGLPRRGGASEKAGSVASRVHYNQGVARAIGPGLREKWSSKQPKQQGEKGI